MLYPFRAVYWLLDNTIRYGPRVKVKFPYTDLKHKIFIYSGEGIDDCHLRYPIAQNINKRKSKMYVLKIPEPRFGHWLAEHYIIGLT